MQGVPVVWMCSKRSPDRAMNTIPLIVERLQKLPPEKLLVVYDFVSFLEERTSGEVLKEPHAEAYKTMLASEAVCAFEPSSFTVPTTSRFAPGVAVPTPTFP